MLGLHEFDSVRKRMSVVIRFPDDSVKVLVKGADTSMFSILGKGMDTDDHVQAATQAHLVEYSSLGLRTLVLAARDLTDEELEEWQQKYEDASTSLTDRSAKLRQTASLIERDLKLLGATGIEDKLQDGVPEAIESLRQAGIKVWVLTGDKQETAISIGLSCRLLTTDMQQIIINGTSEEECRNLLAEAKSKYFVTSAGFGDQSLKRRKDAANGYLEIPYDSNNVDSVSWNPGKEDELTNSSLALIIDGNSLVYILEKDLESQVCICFVIWDVFSLWIGDLLLWFIAFCVKIWRAVLIARHRLPVCIGHTVLTIYVPFLLCVPFHLMECSIYILSVYSEFHGRYSLTVFVACLQLFELAIACQVVVCCRVAPLQKAGIVDLIKSRTDDLTLAIGDGKFNFIQR